MIKKATSHLIPSIQVVFEACIKWMESQDIMQWYAGYPARKNIVDDIEGGELYYIGEGENVWAVITINEAQDPQYQDVVWNYKGEKILVVHRLAVHPAQQGKGFAQQLMTFAEVYARRNNYAAIRLDAYEGNPHSQRFYQKMAYVHTGYIKYDFQAMRCTTFEKIV